MKRLVLLVLVLVIAAAVSPLAAEEDPRKKFLLGIGKLLKAGNAAAIAKNFPPGKKVELSLRGVKSGRYRSSQAHSLLATYFSRTIQPIKYTLKEPLGSIGKFKMEYRIRENGRKVTGTTCVYLQEAAGGFQIVGIVEY